MTIVIDGILWYWMVDLVKTYNSPRNIIGLSIYLVLPFFMT